MRVLVTGAKGFVGHHLVQHLAASGHAPVACDLPGKNTAPDIPFHAADLRYPADVDRLIADVKPDACIHLGGIAFVPMGWTDPQLVFSVNINGTINLLESIRHHIPQCRVLVVTSAEVYGKPRQNEPLDENSAMEPAGLYGVSKLAADLTALLYARRYSLPILTARPLNHIGPGQSKQFVASSFAEQLVRIKNGKQEPVMRVGNLDAERDFTDVRDVARAYRLLIENGQAGQAYNIASGKLIKIRELLDTLFRLSGMKPRIETDPALFRPADRCPFISTAKIEKDVGWKPQLTLSDSLRELFAHAAGTAGAG
jgi:GDP-4-dehydro-6-deoxy-D-mannose reductase